MIINRKKYLGVQVGVRNVHNPFINFFEKCYLQKIATAENFLCSRMMQLGQYEIDVGQAKNIRIIPCRFYAMF